MAFDLPPEFGYVAAVIVALWVQQNIIFVIPVAMQRKATKISPPTIYPTDSQIKDLKLTPEQVEKYLCAQRVHQNNLEFLAVFLPIFLLAGLHEPRTAALAGAVVWVGRMVTALGYWSAPGARIYGGWFHIPELYIVYLAGSFAYSLISKI